MFNCFKVLEVSIAIFKLKWNWNNTCHKKRDEPWFDSILPFQFKGRENREKNTKITLSRSESWLIGNSEAPYRFYLISSNRVFKVNSVDEEICTKRFEHCRRMVWCLNKQIAPKCLVVSFNVFSFYFFNFAHIFILSTWIQIYIHVSIVQFVAFLCKCSYVYMCVKIKLKLNIKIYAKLIVLKIHFKKKYIFATFSLPYCKIHTN